MSERRCLIFGGAGPIGAALSSVFLIRNWKVFAIDSELFQPTPAHAANVEHPNFNYLKSDILSLTQSELESFAPSCEVLFNFCGPARYSFYTKNPEETIKGLVLGTQVALAYCTRSNSRLIQASSSELYGSAPDSSSFMSEESDLGLSVDSDRAVYAGSKFISEALLESGDFRNFVICRLFNVYGPNFAKDDTRVIPRMLDAINGRGQFELYGDGTQSRSYLFIDDLISAMIELVDRKSKYRLFNIGNPSAISVVELWRLICRLAGKDELPIIRSGLPDKIKFRRPSIERARAELSWNPNVALEEGLVRCLEEI